MRWGFNVLGLFYAERIPVEIWAFVFFGVLTLRENNRIFAHTH